MATYYVTTSGNNANAGTSEGAAWADLGYAVTQATADGDLIYVKVGTYTITTSTAGAAGPIEMGTNALRIEPYTTTAGDGLGRPVISAGSVTSITLLKVGGAFAKESVAERLDLDAVATSNTGVAQTGSRHGNLVDCIVRNAGTAYSNVNTTACVAVDCTTGFTGVIVSGCLADGCTTGFSMGQGAYINLCWAVDCGTGFKCTFYNGFMSCVAAGCTTGFNSTSASANPLLHSCLVTGATTGFDTYANWTLIDCAGWNNTADLDTTPRVNRNFQSLSADPYVDSAGGDYTIDATNGADLLALTTDLQKATLAGYRSLASSASGGGGIQIARGMHGGMRG